ncbi:unnamed protein product [Parnassius apollo]|uniref:(apollo) hypothetical protein n=1 Tax=Parnassius apollo TaxID=110799 RepID=A0A8S3WB39_PARAO|nr:unnamed protein product [Parnassius apollo]
MERLWNASKGSKKDSSHEMTRSSYSLVPSGEVTLDTLQLWVGLPEEVKYDPELKNFRNMYENIGKSELRPVNQKNGSERRAKRLPLVFSAPLLDGKDYAGTEEKITNDCTNNDGGAAIQILEHKGDTRVQPASGSQTKIKTAKYYTKMALLLGCWIFFTVVFLMFNEKKEVYKNTAITPGEVKNYTINASEIHSILVRISGPFLSEQAEIKMNSSEMETKEKLIVWLEKWPITDNSSMLIEKASNFRIIILQDPDLNFNKDEPRALKFEFGRSTNDTTHAVHMRTKTNRTVAFAMSLTSDPLDVSTGVIYACFLLDGLYVLIIFEVRF